MTFYAHPDECPACAGAGWKCESCGGTGKINLVEWDCCDEHQTTFRKGESCPQCELVDHTDPQASPAERYPYMPDEDLNRGNE
jgi:RecJ-like exonuclease